MPSGWDGAFIDYDDLGATSVDFGPLSEFLATPVAGMHVVAIAHGVGCTFSAPTGWTQKASVTAGSDLTARVFHIVLPSASWSGIDLEFPSDATRLGVHDAAQASAVELMHFSPTTGSLQVASDTDVGTSSHTVAVCDPSWLSPWQSWTLKGNYGSASFSSFSYDNQISASWSATGDLPDTLTVRYRSNGPVLGNGYGPLSGSSVSESGSNSCDWISLAFGWL